MKISQLALFTLTWCLLGAIHTHAELIFNDTFDRKDGSKTSDDIGNGWSTNSAWRADGEKQAFLENGVLSIRRLENANHAVSVKHDFPLGDCSVSMKFKIGQGDQLGVNFNDPELKTSHAGHVCSVRVTTSKLSIADQMNGSMNLVLRERKQAGDTSTDLKEAIAKTEKSSDISLKPDSWHELNFDIRGDLTKIYINDKLLLEFRSSGFAHPTKANIALSVPKNVVVDDFKVWNKAGRK
ncbi:MAG: hypothetical protein O3C43_20375 [Verrucomicrobia bacterium]|nr:hypothetical protein [Verrucomicrobiota bacterium]MDA1068848.1 hypothetical protein [Verrucomicrobiota bacterium]